MGSISNLSSTYLQSLLGTVLQTAGLTANTAANTQSAAGASALGLPSDSSQLSPFAQLMSTLQQLQQSNPTEYKQVTQQIATNLQNAAQTAQSAGNTTAANQLNQLATDFTNASTSGQLPNIQDLAQAIGGQASGAHGHHHHHHHASSSDADNSLNPMSIISNTLSNAGISTSNS